MNKSDYFRLWGKFSRQVYDGDVRRSWVHVYPLDAQAVRQYGKVCRRARQRRGEDLVVGFETRPSSVRAFEQVHGDMRRTRRAVRRHYVLVI